VKDYDLFIPLYNNDGSPIEPAKFQELQARLLQRFEGLTYFRSQIRASGNSET